MNTRQEGAQIPPLPFSPPALAALARGKQEAIGLNHGFFGSEHLLLGLATAQGTVEIFENYGITNPLEKFREAVDFAVGRGGSPPPQEELRATTRLKGILELAYQQVTRRGQTQITPIDLLIAIILEGDSIATVVLNYCGLLSRLKQRFSQITP